MGRNVRIRRRRWSQPWRTADLVRAGETSSSHGQPKRFLTRGQDNLPAQPASRREEKGGQGARRGRRPPRCHVARVATWREEYTPMFYRPQALPRDVWSTMPFLTASLRCEDGAGG